LNEAATLAASLGIAAKRGPFLLRFGPRNTFVGSLFKLFSRHNLIRYHRWISASV
jgi:hypothetical protein